MALSGVLVRVCCWPGVRSLWRRKASVRVIIDQDAAGPGGTDMQAILSLVNSADTDVLGITDPDGRRVARRRGAAHPAADGNYWPDGYSGGSGRDVSVGKHKGVHREVGNDVWKAGL